MRSPVRFLIEAGARGRVVARGIDEDVCLEAASLSALEEAAHELVGRLYGADRGVSLLLGGPRPRPRR